MSRLIIVISLICVIIASCFVGIEYAKNTRDSMFTVTQAATVHCQNEDKSALADSVFEMEDIFNDRVLILSLYIRHEELERIETLIAVLKSYVATDSFLNAITCLEEIRFLSNHLYERERLNLNNLF